MKDLADWTPKTDSQFKKRSLFAFDMDETLTTEGRLTSSTIQALEELGKAGLKRVIVTGRPAGWADALMKLLPVDAVVAENGGLLFYRKSQDQHVAPDLLFWSAQGYSPNFPKDLKNQEKFQAILKEATKRFPSVREARDQFARIYDLAIDFAEFIHPPLSFEDADQIRLIFEKFGAKAKVSSIHVNGWFGDFSKFNGLRELAEKIWKMDLVKAGVYMGDSPNDAPLFEKMELSIGVQNLKNFERLSFIRPTYITKLPEGEGASEAIRYFLKIRGRG